MLKCTPSWSKDRKLLSALTAVALHVLILELRDVTYYIHQWIVKQLVFCAADGSDRLISHLTSLLAIASPSPFPSFSSPLSLPQKWIRPPYSSSHTDSSSQKQCFLLCRTAGWLHALWLTTTASFVLHISESDDRIISFSVAVGRRTALSFYFTLHLRSRGHVIAVAKATCKLFKILPNSLPLILSAFFFLFSTSLFLYSSIL